MKTKADVELEGLAPAGIWETFSVSFKLVNFILRAM